MNRRTFLATLGTLAAGSVGAIGTGAFTSVSAARTTAISVAADENAYLAIDRFDGPNGDYMVQQNGKWGLYLNGESSPPGAGLNAESTYRIENIFTIKNLGTQSVAVWLDPPGHHDDRRFNWGGGDDVESSHDDSDGHDGGDGHDGDDGHDDGHDGGHGENPTLKPGRDFKFLNENAGGTDTGNGRGHEQYDPVRCGTQLDVGEQVVVGLDITVPGGEIGDALDDERTIYASATPPGWLTERPQ